jgi:hypothetical protein
MSCGPEVAGSVYHPRQPQQAPFYQLVQRFYPRLESVYAERYQERYGSWRPIIGRSFQTSPSSEHRHRQKWSPLP